MVPRRFFTLIIEQRPHLSRVDSSNKGVTNPKRSSLDNNRRDDTPAMVNLGLDNLSLGPAGIICL